MAKEDDYAFLSMMNELEKEPEARLLGQNVKLEHRLIVASFISITIAWVASYFLLDHLSYIFIFVLAMCNAYCLEWVSLGLVTKLSFRASSEKS